MKKAISKLLAVIIVIGILLTAIPLNAFADEFQYGDYRYIIKSDNTVAITEYYGYNNGFVSGEFFIPEVIDGYTVTEIKTLAFSGNGCDILVIPASITKIQTKAFSNFPTKEFVVAEGNPNFKTIDGVLFSPDGKKLLMCPSSYRNRAYTIPETVEEIAAWAFDSCHRIDTLIIPEGVKKIGSYSFFRCTTLWQISIPESVTYIGEGAFMGSDNIDQIYLPGSIQYMGDYVFDGCNLVIKAPYGSLAYEYALQNEIDCEDFIKPISVELLDYNNNIIQNTNGYYNHFTDEAGNNFSYFYYHSPHIPRIRLTYADGSVEEYQSHEFEQTFGEYISGSSDQSEINQWNADEEHSFYYVILGCSYELKVNILAEPKIENFSIRPKEYYQQFLENTDGEWMTEYGEDGEELTYWYYYIYLDSFYYSFTYNGNNYIDVDRYSVESILGGVSPSYTEGTQQSYYNQWQIGDNTVSITLLGNTATTIIKVTESPQIENFSITPYPYYATFIENTNGMWVTEYHTTEPKTFWRYNIYLDSFYYSFTYNGIYYNQVSYHNLNSILGAISCKFVPKTTQTYYNQWSVGYNNVAITLLNQTATATIEVVKAPEITNLSIRPKDYCAQIIENTRGYFESFLDAGASEPVQWYKYEIYPSDFYYSFTYNGTDYTDVEYYRLSEIFGVVVNLDFTDNTHQSYYNQWTLGNNTVSISMFGNTASTTIEIVEKPDIIDFSIRPFEDRAQFIENTNGYWEHYQDPITNELKEFWFYYIQPDNFYYSFTYNGTTYTDVTRYDLEGIFGNIDVLFTSDTIQSPYNQWKIGYNTVSLTLFGNTASTTIEVVKAPELENFSIRPTESYDQIIENTNGYRQYYEDPVTFETREFWRYNIYDDSFYYSFTYNGTTYTDVTRYELQEIFGNINVSFTSDTTQSPYNQWKIGYNTISLTLFGNTASTTIEIVKAPEITNLSVKNNGSFIYENTNGYLQHEPSVPGENITYWVYNFSPESLIYSFDYNGKTYKDVRGYELYQILGVWPRIADESRQSYNNQWTVGENLVIIEVLGKKASTYITIKKQPEITNLRAEYVGEELIENCNGYWYQMGDNNRFWQYHIWESDFVFSFVDANGDKYENLTIDELYRLYDRAPALVNFQDTPEQALTVGDNYATFEFFGNTTKAKVTINKSPYTKIELTPKKPLLVNDEVYIDYDENGNPYNIYYYDFKVKLYHQNGTCIDYDSIYDLENDLSTYLEVIDDQSAENPWGIGKHQAIVKVAGLTAVGEVEIVKSNVKSIKLVSNIKTELFTGYEEIDLNGKTVEIEYEDGTKLRHTIKKDPSNYSIIYSMGEDNYYYIGDYRLKCQYLYNEDGMTIRISYAGAYTDIPITIYEPEIVSAEFIKEPQSSDYANAVIRITLEDGTTKDFTIKHGYRTEGSYSYGNENFWTDFVEVYFVTDQGLFSAWYTQKYNSSTNEMISSELHFLDSVLTTTEENLIEFNHQLGLEYYINAIVPNYLNIPGFNMEFNGEVTADNIDYLIYAFVDLEPAVDNYDGMSAEYISTQLRERLNIKGEIDLTLSRLYNAEKDLYQFVYYFEHYSENCKVYLDVTKLENGNNKYVYEYWFDNSCYYTIVAEMSEDGVVYSISNAIEKGDVNADGEINVLDLVKLKKISLQAETENIDFADVERDGVVNGLDLANERKLIFNKI